MGRWHLRLAELQSGSRDTQTTVQSVQNVQNPLGSARFERFERFERPERLRVMPLPEPAKVLGEEQEEREAVAEYDGGTLRAWAEAIARLDPAAPPGDVPPKRWVQFLDDCGRFLDEGWVKKCEALGWRALDLFGCDRERPWARIDQAGLLWLFNGHKLVALTANTATIESATGARQTYSRVPIEPGRVVLAWELNSLQ
jgi:hypothetical protein